MEVLVTGGTGFLGRHLCTTLVDRGHDVIAMARHPEDAPLPSEVERRKGDVTEFEGLTDAIDGVDAVVHLVALSPLYRPRGGEQMHEQVHVQGTRNVVRAMEAVEIDHLLHLSGVSVGTDAPTVYLRTKGRAEDIVRTAEVDATIIRPTVIFGPGGEFIPFVKKLTTPYLTGLPGGGQMAFQPIWVGDIVEMLADALEDDRHRGETYHIGGPDRLTLADITRLVYGASGRSVRILPIPMVLARIGLTIAEPIPIIPFGRDQYRSLQLENTLDENDIDVFGVAPEDLLQFETYLTDSAPEL